MHKKRILKNTSGVHGSSRKPTKKCAMKMKQRKNDGRLKYFCGQEGVYKTRAESSCNEYQTTSAQRFLIHLRYYLFSKLVNGCQGDGFRAWAHERAPLNSQWLVLRIGGADFLHCWVTDSI